MMSSALVLMLVAATALAAETKPAAPAAAKPAAAKPASAPAPKTPAASAEKAPAAPTATAAATPEPAPLEKLEVKTTDAGRTGATSDTGPERPGGIVWSQPVAANAVSDPTIAVVGEKRVVLMGSGDDVIALDARDGAPLWSDRMEMLVSAPPAVAGGVAIVQGIEGVIRFSDAATGKKIKDVENDYNLEAPGILIGDLFVYEETSRAGGKSKSRLHGMDLKTRTDRWRSDYVGGTGRAPSTDGQRVFVATESSILAFAATDGSELWAHEFTPAARVYEPVMRDGRILSARGGYGPGTLEAIDAATGTSLWTKQTAARIGAAPSVGEDEIVLPLMNQTLARYGLDGTERAAIATPGRVDIRAVVTPTRVYSGAAKKVGAIDRATQKVAWTLDMDGDAALLAVDGARLLVARRDGFLHAVESAAAPAP